MAHEFAGGRKGRGVGVDVGDVAQEVGALQAALDVGHERRRDDDDLAAARGDEFEQILDAVDDFDRSETLLDLTSCHPDLKMSWLVRINPINLMHSEGYNDPIALSVARISFTTVT